MAKKTTGATGNTPAPAAKTAPAPAAKPAPGKPGIFSKIITLALLIMVANSATGRAANRYAQEHLTALYRRMWTAIFAFIFIAAIGFYGFTLHGMEEVNIYVALFYGLLILLTATRSDLLMAVLYGGVAVDVLDDDEKKGVKSVFALYGELTLTVMFIAMSTHTFIGLGIVDFTQNPKAFPTLILLVILLLQMKKLFNFGGKLGATTAYIFTALMLIFQVSTLISQAWLIDKFGRDPLAFFRVAEDKKEIHKIEAKNIENKVKDNKESLKKLREAVDNGEILTPDQLSDLEEKRKTAARNAAGIKPISYTDEELNWETWNTFAVAPNTWSPESYGWKLLITFNLAEPIVIKVDATGIYQKRYKDGDLPEYYVPVDIKTGIEKFTPPYKNKLPLQNHNPGCGVVMVNGAIYPLGAEITITGYTEVYFSINSPQNWSDTGDPKDNFAKNIGEVEVILKKRV